MALFKHHHNWRNKTTLNNIVNEDKQVIGAILLEECYCGDVRTIEIKPGEKPIIRNAKEV